MHGKRMKNGEKWEIIRNRGRGWKKFRFLHLWIWVYRGGLRERMRWDWIRWDILWMYDDFLVLFCESIVDNIGLLSIMIDFLRLFYINNIYTIWYNIILSLFSLLWWSWERKERKSIFLRWKFPWLFSSVIAFHFILSIKGNCIVITSCFLIFLIINW